MSVYSEFSNREMKKSVLHHMLKLRTVDVESFLKRCQEFSLSIDWKIIVLPFTVVTRRADCPKFSFDSKN